MLKEITVSNLKLNCSCVNVLISNSRLLGTKLGPPPSGLSNPRSIPLRTRTVSFLIDQPMLSILTPAESIVSPPFSMKFASVYGVAVTSLESKKGNA